MAKNVDHIQHIKSNIVVEIDGVKYPKLPNPSALTEGEIAINYAKDYETISLKNESGDVVTFSSDKMFYTKDEIDRTESATSASLNDLNIRKLDASAYTPITIDQVIDSTTSGSSGAVSTSAVYNYVTSYTPSITVDQVLDDTTSASTNPVSSKAVYDAITDNEFVIASLYNEMSGAVSSHTSNTDIHVTTADKTAWNAKLDASAYTELWESGSGVSSVVLKGSSGTASGDYSVAEGYQTSATSYDSHAEGGLTLASGSYSHAEGYKTSATTYEAHAEGQNTIASGSSSHAEGNNTTASGDYSHSEGYNTKASGSQSHAEGNSTTASGYSSHAEGSNTVASGNYSHAEGYNATASGASSHAEGWATKASGSCSHAEGNSTTASSDYSHAEGSNAIASGESSHAEGFYTKANGKYSHAEGFFTTASGSQSHAEGNYTIANNQSEHASGQFNISNSASTTFGDSGNTLFSVGNGTYGNNHNAFEIRQNGDIYIVSGGTDILLQDNLGGNIEIDQVIDSGTSASTNAVATKAVYDKIVEDEQVWAMSLNELNNNKFGYANFDSTDSTLYFYKNEDDYTSGGTAIDSVDLSDISIDIDQVIDSGTSASTDAVSTSAVYGFVTSYTPSITVDQDFSNTASTNPISTKAVYSAITDNELVWTNAFVALSGTVSAHTANTDIHVTAADKTAWNAKLDASAIADFFDDAKYEDSGTTKVINFYHGNTIKATIDASDFIVDGMVDDVRIENGNLVIDFNTASGKQDISIPLTDIFDPSNYYDKDDIDELVGSGFTSSSITEVIIENEEIVSAALTDLDERKLDVSAYTPSVELWESGTGLNSVVLKDSNGTASGDYSVAEGYYSTADGNYSHAEGDGTVASGESSHAEGSYTTASGYSSHAEGDNAYAEGSCSHAEGRSTLASGDRSHAEGYLTTASGESSHAEGETTTADGDCSHAEGYGTIANNKSEHASGQYNVSISASTTFGDSGNTLFSVGNGTSTSARHNAFEIRQNGDIYITSGNSDIKLQDYIGSVETVTAITPSNSGSTDPIATKVVAENELTVSNALNDLNTNKADKEDLGGLKLVKVTQAEYDALTTKDPNTLYVIVN